MIGAKIVLAKPPARVRIVRAPTARGPYQWVNAANAGGYNTPAMATPATSHAATNTGRVGATAMATTASTATTDPSVITPRGPCRSIHRPTPTPATAETTRPAENAAVNVGGDQPVAALIRPDSTGNA